MKDKLRYKGRGEHSVNNLEAIVEQRDEEISLLRLENQKKQANIQAFPMDYAMEGARMESGMSLLDYFAAKSLNGILSNSDTLREMTRAYEKSKKTTSFEVGLSKMAYDFAKGMLEARDEENSYKKALVSRVWSDIFNNETLTFNNVDEYYNSLKNEF